MRREAMADNAARSGRRGPTTWVPAPRGAVPGEQPQRTPPRWGTLKARLHGIPLTARRKPGGTAAPWQTAAPPPVLARWLGAGCLLRRMTQVTVRPPATTYIDPCRPFHRSGVTLLPGTILRAMLYRHHRLRLQIIGPPNAMGGTASWERDTTINAFAGHEHRRHTTGALHPRPANC